MAANNFFSYATAGGFGAFASATPVAAPTVGLPSTTAQVAAGFVAQQAAAVASSPTFRASPAPGVVAYTAYQPGQTAVTAASYVAPPSFHGNTFAQYPVPVAAFDNRKATGFYTQPTCESPTVSYTVSDPHYQARPVYTANSSVTLAPSVTAEAMQPHTVSVANNAIAAAAAAAAAAAVTHVPRPSAYTYATTYAVQSSPSYTFVQQQPQKADIYSQIRTNLITPVTVPSSLALTTISYPNAKSNRLIKPKKIMSNNSNVVNGSQNQANRKQKQSQLQYCELCKISCAGPQTYKEHLNGQKHKKKEASAQLNGSCTNGNGTASSSVGSAPGSQMNNRSSPRAQAGLWCELCSIMCTGTDAYAAHLRGAKHQKVLKLHQKLGKPIPVVDIKISPDNFSQVQKDAPIQTVEDSSRSNQVTSESQSPGNSSDPAGPGSQQQQQDQLLSSLSFQQNVQPVGGDYIEEVKDESGKLVSFNCKLCECRFNDPNAKEMHMKGKKHRLHYKKKVNPDLIVDTKQSSKKKMADDGSKKIFMKDDFWMRRDEEFQAMEEQECQFWQNSQFFHEGVNGDAPHHRQRGGWGWGMAPQMPLGYMVSSMLRHHGSFDDRLVLSKHSEIFPDDDSLLVIQKQVLNVEKSLKAVSDDLAVAKGSTPDNRQLKGIMRVGILAKGLLLKCDSTVQLVLLCTHYPTKDLLESVASALPAQLEENAAGATYDVVANVQEAAVVVKVLNAPMALQIEVLFSSPTVREAVANKSFPVNPLSEEKCLHALAELRQAKWFQVKASMLHSCMIIVRILRDLCLRNDAWRPFYGFFIELLTERVLASSPVPLSPADALRRVFEAVSSGLLLSDASSLLDPCKKEPSDICQSVPLQVRETLTYSAQNLLRLMAFKRTYVVLGTEPLPVSKYGPANRKRPAQQGQAAVDAKPGQDPDEPASKASKEEGPPAE